MVRKPKPTRFYHNFKLSMLLILLPLGIGALALYYALAGPLTTHLAALGNNRLVTDNWQTAYAFLANAQPDYGPSNAYYRLKLGQNLDWVAQHFSVDAAKIRQLNPGTVAYGTTISIPPLEQPLQASISTRNLETVKLERVDGIWQLSNDFRSPIIRTNLAELASFLAPYGVITKLAEKHYRLNQPLNIQNNIRLDITGDTVEKLELASAPNFGIVCLCYENSEGLIKDTVITSVDPATNRPDYEPADGRSFIRALKSSRLDIIKSDISYLGSDLVAGHETQPVMSSGGIYGVSWRISVGALGKDIATGWVEDSFFHNNYFGAYTFGASGMVWRGNSFTDNDIYGLDPHDDSNNMLIEKNRFLRNGRHGFIVSKRCLYNVIFDNYSADNKLNGFMLDANSNYNLIDNNVAAGNTDNYVINNSSYNTIRANESYKPISNHLRVDTNVEHTYIQNNQFVGGQRGIILQNRVDGALIEGNSFKELDQILNTNQASRVLFANNSINRLSYDITPSDRVIFGPNVIKN